MAKHLRLESLELDITIEEKEIEDMLAARERYVTATGIRQLHVTERFELKVDFNLDVDTDVVSPGLPYRHRETMLSEKYGPLIEERMIPNTLRDRRRRQPSEQEQYLKNRRGEQKS